MKASVPARVISPTVETHGVELSVLWVKISSHHTRKKFSFGERLLPLGAFAGAIA